MDRRPRTAQNTKPHHLTEHQTHHTAWVRVCRTCECPTLMCGHLHDCCPPPPPPRGPLAAGARQDLCPGPGGGLEHAPAWCVGIGGENMSKGGLEREDVRGRRVQWRALGARVEQPSRYAFEQGEQHAGCPLLSPALFLTQTPRQHTTPCAPAPDRHRTGHRHRGSHVSDNPRVSGVDTA